MKKKTFYLIKAILKILLPALLGWLEGDSHAVTDGVLNLLSFLF